MIRLRDLLFEETIKKDIPYKNTDNLVEYTDAQKKKMGIPPGAKASGGRWYVGDKYVGRVVDGKFVKVKTSAKKKTTPTEQPIKINPKITVKSPIEPTYYAGLADEDSINAEVHQSFGITPKEVQYRRPPANLVKESKAHGDVIDEDVHLNNIIERWTGKISLWSNQNSETRRNMMVKAINNAIRTNNFVVSQEKLYRGTHASKGKAVSFSKTVINEFAPGKIVKLPPAGFSTELWVALNFAKIGTPEISVLFTLLPSKNKKIRGMHVSSAFGVGHPEEMEVITEGGQYKVISAIVQPVTNGSLNAHVILEQLENTNEEIVTETTGVNKESLIDIFFMDSMSNTANNLSKLSK